MKIKPSTSLEQQCNDIWGPSQFNWTIGRTGNPKTDYSDHLYDRNANSVWFWYCGTNENNHWLNSGYSNTIDEALQSIIDSK
jgi:hypothetical protein